MSSTVFTSDHGANRAAQAEGADPLHASAEVKSTLQTAYKLKALVKNVESFIVEQFRRLDALLASRPAPAGSDGFSDAQRAELLRQQAAWERQKNDEYLRLEQERELLCEAWTRVEAEQRRVLAEDAVRRAQASTALEAQPGAMREMVAEPDRLTARSRSAEATNVQASAVPHDGIPRDTVLLEYEQLKKDVHKHAQRRRHAK